MTSFEELRDGVIELGRLERESHEIRGPRYGLGDGERASLRHAQLVAELTLSIRALQVAHTEALDALEYLVDASNMLIQQAKARDVLRKAGR